MERGMERVDGVKRLLMGIAGALLFSSCASMFGGVEKDVKVTSEPPGALVRLDGVTRGLTPVVLHPSTRFNHQIRVEMPGYESAEIALRRGISAWELGNVLNGLFPGIVYDGATGAIYRFLPGKVEVRLEPRPRKTEMSPGARPEKGAEGRG